MAIIISKTFNTEYKGKQNKLHLRVYTKQFLMLHFLFLLKNVHVQNEIDLSKWRHRNHR
jgi:hypothetical protein